MSVASLWAQYRDELASDPFLILALSAALVALATTPMVFAVLGRQDRGALERVRAFRLTPIPERSLP